MTKSTETTSKTKSAAKKVDWKKVERYVRQLIGQTILSTMAIGFIMDHIAQTRSVALPIGAVVVGFILFFTNRK